MELSIIIINYNTPSLTIDCLNSIYRYTQNISFEIILVDNCPKENYQTAFLDAFPEIKYLKSEYNIGFGRANNLGMEIAQGKYWLLLNNDTILLENTFLKCYEFMEKHTDIGLLGCKLLNEDLSYQNSFYPFTKKHFLNYCISNNPVLYKLFNAGKYFIPPQSPKEVGDISGAYMFLRQSVYQKTGGFDPDFFLYCEETEWCRNRILKYFKIVYYPETSIIHLGGKSAPKEPMEIQSLISQGLYWYKKSSASYCGFICFSVCNALYYQFGAFFVNSEKSSMMKKYARNIYRAMPYWLTDIPRYKRKTGSRATPLIYAGARSIFFN